MGICPFTISRPGTFPVMPGKCICTKFANLRGFIALRPVRILVSTSTLKVSPTLNKVPPLFPSEAIRSGDKILNTPSLPIHPLLPVLAPNLAA